MSVYPVLLVSTVLLKDLRSRLEIVHLAISVLSELSLPINIHVQCLHFCLMLQPRILHLALLVYLVIIVHTKD